jgi:hypothetical protein
MEGRAILTDDDINGARKAATDETMRTTVLSGAGESDFIELPIKH